MIIDFSRIMAKSDGVTTLCIHTWAVITAGINLLERLPLTPKERAYWLAKVYRCAVLHDLGKVHPSFPLQFTAGKKMYIRHEIISLWFCENFLNLPVEERFAIATHHKEIIPLVDKPGCLSHIIIGDTQYHYHASAEMMTRSVLLQWLELMQLDLKVNTGGISMEISPEMRNTLYCLEQAAAVPDLATRKQLSLMRVLLMAADHIASAGLEKDIPVYKAISIKDFQPENNGIYFPFRQFQLQLQNTRKDVMVHAPTASGKTIAAFSWIYANQRHNNHVFYVLPTTASINAMVKPLQAVFGKDTVTTRHSKSLNFFYEELAQSTPEHSRDYKAITQSAWSAKTLSAELFYPVKVTTLHQLLITSLKGQGWEFGLLDYKNALFVIDEFHTYDALLMGLMLATVKLFRKVFNAKFLFMSATIPAFMIKFMVKEIFDGDESSIVRPNPAFESDRIILGRKRHQLYCQPGKTILDDIPLIRAYLEQRSVLIIVNNVKTAQALYHNFRDIESIAMLHGGLHEADRISVERRITHTNPTQRPRLLIATQAVEVSLNLDYDIPFIENAPIDALIQRLGRANRAGEKEIYPLGYMVALKYKTVPVYLYENSVGRTPFYQQEVLDTTWQQLLLYDKKELSEDDLVHICDAVYANGYNETQQKDFDQGLHNDTIRNFETDWVAGHSNGQVEITIHHQYQKVEVLCGNLVDEFNEKRRQGRYVEANQLLVQVYFYELKKRVDHPYVQVIIAPDLEYLAGVGYREKEVCI